MNLREGYILSCVYIYGERERERCHKIHRSPSSTIYSGLRELYN